MLLPTTSSALLAQASNVSDIVSATFEVLTTPSGMLGAAIGFVFLAAVFIRRDGPYIGGAAVIVFMTMMAQENKYFDTTLIGPLHALRDVARVGSLAVLALMAANLAMAPANLRQRRATLAMVLFFAFETLYLGRLALHGEVSRAALGWLADLLILLAFGIGFGKKLDTEADFERYVRMFGAASIVFVVLNITQLLLGYRYAIAGGRFAGISGNPQLAGYVCAVFILFNTHIFTTSKFGSPARWIYAITLGILAILILWSGSRTSALCAVAGLLAYFRLRLGKLIVAAGVGGIVLFFAASFFSESLDGINRFIEGENTREAVWTKLIEDFNSSPMLGTIQERQGEVISASESSYLTTLSLMGLSGFIPLMFLVFVFMWGALKVYMARLSRTVNPAQADLVLGCIPIIMIGSVFEGFFLGILAFSVIWIYAAMSLVGYINERAAVPIEGERLELESQDEFEGDEHVDDGELDRGEFDQGERATTSHA